MNRRNQMSTKARQAIKRIKEHLKIRVRNQVFYKSLGVIISNWKADNSTNSREQLWISLRELTHIINVYSGCVKRVTAVHPISGKTYKLRHLSAADFGAVIDSKKFGNSIARYFRSKRSYLVTR
jgi:hypothetical protein